MLGSVDEDDDDGDDKFGGDSDWAEDELDETIQRVRIGGKIRDMN